MALESALNRTSFWADLKTLVFEPKKLFSFFGSFEEISPWLLFKILWGFFVFSIVGGLSSVGEGMNSLSHLFASLDQAMGFDLFSRSLLKLEWWFLVFGVMAQPFIKFFQLAASAGLCFLGLSLLGLRPERVGYFKILMVFCYLGWLQVFKLLLPGVSGAIILGIWTLLIGIYAFRWIFRTDSWTAYVAYSFGGWVAYFVSLAFIAGGTGAAVAILSGI